MPAPHNIDHERELWNTYAESTKDKVFDAAPTFCRTQYAGHGPGSELLGDPETVLEIGCGTGRHLAYLAQQGVKTTGVDLSPVWEEHPREAGFEHAQAYDIDAPEPGHIGTLLVRASRAVGP